MHTLDILRRPIITEKSTEMQDAGRYTFEVMRGANKYQIKQAVEEAFEVSVIRVNTMNMRGKRKKLGPRTSVRPAWKKAVVTLKPGDTITIFEGV